MGKNTVAKSPHGETPKLRFNKQALPHVVTAKANLCLLIDQLENLAGYLDAVDESQTQVYDLALGIGATLKISTDFARRIHKQLGAAFEEGGEA